MMIIIIIIINPGLTCVCVLSYAGHGDRCPSMQDSFLVPLPESALHRICVFPGPCGLGPYAAAR
eukprot:38708-Karenia_brevis.AAC.1